jgi:hypothetical protein
MRASLPSYNQWNEMKLRLKTNRKTIAIAMVCLPAVSFAATPFVNGPASQNAANQFSKPQTFNQGKVTTSQEYDAVAYGSWEGAMTLGDGLPDGVTFADNVVSDVQSTPTMLYGLAIMKAPSHTWAIQPINLAISGNTISNAVTGALLDQSMATSKVISKNQGIDDVIPSVASAATLALPVNPKIALTGTTGVTSLTGVCPGRDVRVIPSGVVTFTAGE